MKTLVTSVNGKELTFSVVGCKSSCDFFFKVSRMIYEAHNTTEEICEQDDELFMSCLKARNEVLSYFLN